MKKSLRTAFVAAATSAVALAASSSAMAAAPTGDYARFKYCPYANTSVLQCVYSKISSGSFTLGNASVPITSSNPIVLQGGIGPGDPDTGENPWFNAANGGDTLSRTPLDVPGGLIGLVSTGGWSGLLIDLFNAAVHSVNGVTATAELAGGIRFNATNILGGDGTGLTLPIKVHLQNPFLGANCYIGSNSNPVTLRLTTGTTAPPAPNRPITGNIGDTQFNPDFTITTTTGLKLVDNAFAAPAASDCGYLLLDKLLITAGVNAREGLPAAAGKNTAIQQGDNTLGYRAAVQGSVR